MKIPRSKSGLQPGKYRFGLFQVLMAILMALSAGSCKKDMNDEAIEAERQRADSILQASIENRKRLETEEELAERIRRLKNNRFRSRDSVYYQAAVIPVSDSLLSGIELMGKASNEGKINTFSHTAIALNGQIVKGVLPGVLFKTENLPLKNYSLYTLDRETGSVQTFEIKGAGDSLYFQPAAVTGNYYFELLNRKQFEYELKDATRFFKTIKADRIYNSFPADTSAPYIAWYHDREKIFPENIPAPVERYWRRSPVEISNLLINRTTDSTYQAMVLSGRRKTGNVTTLTGSSFMNDTVFVQYKVRDSLVYDHPHLVVYQKDSLTSYYAYNKAFEFSLIRTDSVKVIENYPQQYRELKDSIFELETAAFEMNGRKVHWRYNVHYINNSPFESRVKVGVDHKDLIEHESRKLVFRLPRTGTPTNTSIADLLTPEEFYRKEDLNFDGYTDFSFRKGKDNNGNPEYMVYLYSPQYGRFSRSPGLDGKSIVNGIIADSIQKRLLYPGAIGNGHLSVSIIHPQQTETSQKEVFWTTGSVSAPQVHYQKMVNNSITVKRSPLIDSLPVINNNLQRTLISWIRQQGYV